LNLWRIVLRSRARGNDEAESFMGVGVIGVVVAAAVAAPFVCDTAAAARTPTDPGTGLYATVGTSPQKIYPYVVDGYRDRAMIVVAFNYENDVPCANDQTSYEATVVIRKRNGQPVRHFTKANGDGYFQFFWNGRTYSGKRAKVGAYHVTLDGLAVCDRTDGTGVTDVELDYSGSAVKASVARGFKWVDRGKTKYARYAATHSASGGCSSHAHNYGWLLDCESVGGRASASWLVNVQRPYRRLSVSFPDSLHAGPVDTSLTRAGTNKVRIGVSVPGYAWAYVDRLRVTYEVRKPI
jgi:hypothetical protein